MYKYFFVNSFFVMTLLTSQTLKANPDQVHHSTGKPPEEAIQICLNQSENSECTMSRNGHSEKGFCEWTPDKKYYACNPKRGSQHGQEQFNLRQKNDDQVTRFPSHLVKTPS